MMMNPWLMFTGNFSGLRPVFLTNPLSLSTTIPEETIRSDPSTADLYDDNQVGHIIP